MVRAAKSSEHCTVKMAKDKASPRFSIFRSKRMKGWWPLIKLKSQEDIEREEREAELEKKNKKKKKRSKRSKMKPEDIQFVDSSGNTFLLMVLNVQRSLYFSAVMIMMMIIIVKNIGFMDCKTI